jgi:5-methyltetrahydrofolate--homocysteine methyltransferase
MGKGYSSLQDLLDDHQPILMDGAMGTQLAALGLPMGGQNNLTHPEQVASIHQRYLESGCQLLTTNTLTMNRIYIETHHLDVDVREVNLAGVELARSVAKGKRFVLGDMSSTGKILEPYGDLPEAEAFKAFKEQATALADGGVHGFIIETMLDLREALCALRACADIAPLPIFASMAFTTQQHGGRTIMGDTAEACARTLTDAGASVVGANCGDLDPFQMAEIVSMMVKVTSLPILAQPNAGKPRLVEGQTLFDMSPSEFAKGISECIRAGASLVGGCCGTTPAHIRAIAQLLEENEQETFDHEP